MILFLLFQEGAACNRATFVEKCHDTSSGDRLLPCQLASCHFTGIDNPHYVIYMQRKLFKIVAILKHKRLIQSVINTVFVFAFWEIYILTIFQWSTC